ncbi:MAG: hypothetical protein V2I82_03150 [Halieaceae bacterium]|nr:hypothetical protein [Halieaceae bacterium]
MSQRNPHKWQFSPRFRRHAFGWKSQPAITRIREAVSEIRQVARRDKVLGAEGAVLFLEKLSPAIEHVDSSSGAIGTAVNKAINTLAGIIADAPVDASTRGKWLERLYQAHADEEIPYLELLGDCWGDLCASRELASQWADHLLGITRMALGRDGDSPGHYHGAIMCLSSLHTAQRYDELLDVISEQTLWQYRSWGAQALAARGDSAEAIRYAEQSRSAWSSDLAIDRFCEETLLASGFVDEAYAGYGLRANRASTYKAWFRAVTKKYPRKEPAAILHDLLRTTPGDEGKWFAAAKDAGMLDEAIRLANSSPCSPQTLTRAARDFREKNPAFAIEAGLAALRWLAAGYGYDTTSADVNAACLYTFEAAADAGKVEETERRVRAIAATGVFGDLIDEVLTRQQLER